MKFTSFNKLLLYFSLTTLVVLAGCVTVSLDKKEHMKDEDVQFVAPSSPFYQFKSPYVDLAWRNDTDGSSISFHTDCDDATQTKLHEVSEQIVGDLDKSEFIMKKYELFKRKKAFRTQVKGLLEGIPTQMEFLIFRNSTCIYILNYISMEDTFSKNRPIFNHFQQKFKTP